MALSLGGNSMGALLSGLVGTSSNPVLQPQGGIDLSALRNFAYGNSGSSPTSNPSLPSNINFSGVNQQANGNSNFNPNFAQMGQQMGQMMPNSVFAPNDPGFDGTIYPPEVAFQFMDQFFAQQYPPIWQNSQMMMNAGMQGMQNGMPQQGGWNTGMMVNNAPVNQYNQFNQGYNQYANMGYQPNNMGFGANVNAGYNNFDPNMMAGYNTGYGGFDPGYTDPYAAYSQGYGQPNYPQDDGSGDMMAMVSYLQNMLSSLDPPTQVASAAPPPRTGGIKPAPLPKPPALPVPPTVVAATPAPAPAAGSDDAAILAMLQGLGLGGTTA